MKASMIASKLILSNCYDRMGEVVEYVIYGDMMSDLYTWRTKYKKETGVEQLHLNGEDIRCARESVDLLDVFVTNAKAKLRVDDEIIDHETSVRMLYNKTITLKAANSVCIDMFNNIHQKIALDIDGRGYSDYEELDRFNRVRAKTLVADDTLEHIINNIQKELASWE